MKTSKRTQTHTLLVYITYACMGRSHTPPPTPPPTPKKWSTWHRHAVDVADDATATAIAWTEQNTPHSIHLCMCREWEQRVRQRKCVNAFCYGCWQLYNQNKPRHIQLICTCTCTCYICIYVCMACMYSEKRREENSTVYTLESLKINITMIWALIFALSFSPSHSHTLRRSLSFHSFPSFSSFIWCVHLFADWNWLLNHCVCVSVFPTTCRNKNRYIIHMK